MRSLTAGPFDVSVQLHQEHEDWWAESVDIPGWSAAADTLDGLLLLVSKSMDEMGYSHYSTWSLPTPSEQQ